MEQPLTDMQMRAGLSEARRIIRDARGYVFGGELIPFDERFKELALNAIAQLEQTWKSS